MKKILILGLILFLSCQRSLIKKKTTLFALNTFINITLVDTDNSKINSAINIIRDEFKRIENKFNIFNTESEIYNINRFSGIKPVKVSTETISLIKKAVYYSELTDGYFDITIAPLEFLWGFYEGYEKRIPDGKELRKILKFINYKNIIIDEKRNTVFLKKKGMKIDLSSFIKGYAVDRVIKKLKRIGLKGALIEAGGDLRVFGENLKGCIWKIGIRHPRNNSEIYKVLDIKNQAVATSGDYENFFIKGERKYHHLLNPKTGYPVRNVVSVTVIAKDCMTADLLSTAIFVLGKKKRNEFVKKLQQVKTLILEEKNGKLIN